MPAGPVGACWATGSWTDTCWEENVWGALGAALDFILDLNSRIYVFLADTYSRPTGLDLTSASTRYMATLTEVEATAKFKRLIKDATDATL